jgi:predicted nuclease of restriction endonuclease-like (RecB) superfamily
MSRIEGWSVRTLRAGIDSMLYERPALSKQPEALIRRELETFLLELGAGFSFVARQKRIQLDGDDFISTFCSTTANSGGWS